MYRIFSCFNITPFVGQQQRALKNSIINPIFQLRKGSHRGSWRVTTSGQWLVRDLY